MNYIWEKKIASNKNNDKIKWDKKTRKKKRKKNRLTSENTLDIPPGITLHSRRCVVPWGHSLQV